MKNKSIKEVLKYLKARRRESREMLNQENVDGGTLPHEMMVEHYTKIIDELKSCLN